MRKPIAILAVALLAMALIVGCASEKSVPTMPTPAQGTVTYVPDSFLAQIGVDPTKSNEYGLYLPPGFDSNTSYPVLVLLNGFGGTEDYWTVIFNAADAADWLISRGDIDPMVIVMPSGYNSLGGSFYTNSAHAAVQTSEQHILDVLSEVETTYPNVGGSAAMRGIGGHSMGGFGAISIALNNAGTFSSISVDASPLAFQGEVIPPALPAWPPQDNDTYDGNIELLPKVLEETGYDTVLANTGGVGDATAFRNMMYPSPDRIITSFMFAASAAWSPTEFNPFPVVEAGTIDSMIVGVDDQGVPIRQAIYIDLPIGPDGQLVTNTWMRWLAFDPLSRLSTQGASLANVALFLDAGDADDLGFHGAQQVFAGALQAAAIPGLELVADTYSGVEDADGNLIPADHTTHTWEQLKRMLKFHNDHF